MQLANSILLTTAMYPLWRAWRANRRLALEHAILWAVLAWLAWQVAFLFGNNGMVSRYVALSLTACAGIAVLGARRPHVGAWNFVVASLLAVLLLPIAQGWGKPALSPPFLIFLGATLLFGWLNYLPTRLLPAAMLFGIGAGIEMTTLCGVAVDDYADAAARCLMAASPWLAFFCLVRRRADGNAIDREWLEFRDRFGVVWGQRSREQFNRAAANAGWPIVLSWHGIDITANGTAPSNEAMLDMLRAVLKRFGTKAEND